LKSFAKLCEKLIVLVTDEQKLAEISHVPQLKRAVGVLFPTGSFAARSLAKTFAR